MSQKRKKSSLALGGVLAATTVGAVAPRAVHAQGVESRARSQETATRQFNISAGVLTEALTAFEKAADLTLRVDAPVAALQTKGVTGEFTPQQALTRLLDGTGLTFVFTGTKVVMVRRSGPTVLDAVTVTAEAAARLSSPKFTGPQVDLPRSVSVISSEVMQAQGASSLRDVIRNVPGITINAGEGGALPGDNFNIRGFSATNDIFVDGVRDVSGYSRESFNLEQIEVVKGPNSAVAGRGSTGGSINLVTKTPHMKDERNATVVVGTANQLRGTIDVNQELPITSLHGAALRVSAMMNDAGVAGNEVVKNEGWGVAPSLAFGLASATRLTLAYTHSSQDNIPSYGLESFTALPQYDPRQFYGLRGLDFEKIDSDVGSARIDHAFGEHLRLRNLTTRGNSDTRRIVTPANPTTGARNPKSHIFENTVASNQTNLSADFGAGAVQHSVSAGVEYSHEKSNRGNYLIATQPYPAITDFTDPTASADFHSDITPRVQRQVHATTVGVYAFEKLRAGSHVEVNGGLRWDSYKARYVDSASKATGFQPPDVSNVSGSVGLVLKPADHGSVYFSYSTSFNPSTENLSNDAVNAASELPPEKSRTYEVGTKWEMFKRRVLSSFALFRTEKTNARTSDPANPSLGTILAGKQRVQGAEANLSGNLTPEWNALAGYSYLESEYVESLNPAQQGTQFTNVPKHSVNLWTTYRLPHSIHVGGGTRYVDRRLLRTTDVGSVFVPSYHSYDAMAAYQVKPALGLQLNLYNLTDELYYDSGRMWAPAPGRAISLTASVKF